jgi:hypothetical protein
MLITVFKQTLSLTIILIGGKKKKKKEYSSHSISYSIKKQVKLCISICSIFFSGMCIFLLSDTIEFDT